MQNLDTDFLILGAGWSGLLAAEYLSRHNKRCMILEKEEQVGGLARTLDFCGFKFDIGGHALFFKKEENLDFLKKLCLNGSMSSINRKAKLFFRNGYLDFPPNITSILRLGIENMANIAIDWCCLDKTNENTNFEEWAKSNYGGNLYKIYFKDYSEKVWGLPCKQLSADWARRRIGNNSLTRFLNSFISDKEYGKEAAATFYYPKQGIGMLPVLLEKTLSGRMCKLYKGALTENILAPGNKLSVLDFIHKEKKFRVKFNHLISSIPILELVKLITPYLNQETISCAQKIKYRNLILVNAVVPGRLATDWHWCYFPSRDLSFSRLHEPKFWSGELAPDDGTTMLCSEIFCDYNDNYWKMSQEELVDNVVVDLKSLGLLKKDKVSAFLVKKFEYAYPLLYEGFAEPLIKVKESLDSFDNLVLIGRSGTHSYFDMEDCLDDTRKKVCSLLSLQ